MKNDDVELIQRVLAGDENAFSRLVRKYEKPVHALVWRKIGDFHIAEEITQDAFLQAYKELATLRKPDRFARWLSVIATREGYELRLLDVQTLKQKVVLAQLETYPVKSDPAWSPDGEQIVFVLHKWRTILNFIDAANWQDEETIYVINRDGSNLRQLVSEKGPDALHPTWSPDRNEIIYHRGIHLPEVGDIRQLFKINVNTGTKTQLTNVGSNSGADWFGPPASTDEP